jgi:arylsulfatase
VDVPASGASGVILAQGGRFGGWSLYVKDGKPAYTYNWVGLQQYTTSATERLAPGKAKVKLEFAYDGNGRGKGGSTTIYVNDKKVGSGRVENTNANIFSADDAADVGIDEGTNVSSAYPQHGNKFTGKIEKVLVEVK